MRRVENWPSRLYEFVEDPANAAFAWGTNDCVTFAANCVVRLTGDDPLGELRGTWSTEDEAEAALERMGGLREAVRSVLGEPMENSAMAQRGDVALIEVPDATFLAVHLGDRLVIPTRDGRLAQLKVAHATRVWRIG